ncbi:MAG: hypothetical protein KDK66_02815 [Deltaproteobacteria bacterium]|nr:hypothetical protein [Deltaproteobacteria bacterium]
MNKLDLISKTLQEVIAGDLSHFDVIQNESHDEVNAASQQIGTLWLNRPSLLRVLIDWEKGKLSQKQVQAWGCLMSCGYIWKNGSLKEFNIEYDQAHEDAIIEVLARLYELGDIIDGEISAEELQKMKQSLVT